MAKAIRAGIAYFGVIFALGFALGVVRTLYTAPAFGAAAAVGLEIPIILAASWMTCHWLTAALAVPRAASPRLVMGGVALALTLVAEFALAAAMFGRTPAEHLGSYATITGLTGLAAQLAFAALPVVQLRR